MKQTLEEPILRRVLIEGMTDNYGGKESYIMSIYRIIDKNKYLFDFIAYDDHIAYENEILKSGSQIIHVRPRHKGLFQYKKDLKAVIKRKSYDVVWSHKTTLSSCELLEIAKSGGVPVRVVHSHSSSNMGGKFTYIMHSINKRRVPRIATHLLACSEVASKWFYGDLESTIVKNGLDLKKFEFNSEVRKKVRKQFGLDGKLVLGHVGRFGVEKNHQKLLSIFNAYNKMNHNSCLVLCGDGEERENIEAKIIELGIQDKVYLLGRVNNVNEILQAIDVIVMPSLFEGLPYALLEAQTAGLKCVVSNTVSRESDILGWNKFISLDADDKKWANQINDIDYDYDRQPAFDIMRDNGFDIIDCVNQIEEIIGV